MANNYKLIKKLIIFLIKLSFKTNWIIFYKIHQVIIRHDLQLNVYNIFNNKTSSKWIF